MRLTTSSMIAALLAAGLLSACGANDEAAAAKAGTDSPSPMSSDAQVAAADPAPSATATEAPQAPPAFNYVGLWVENRSQCQGTDHYIAMDKDGTATFWGQNGTWSAQDGAISFRMEASEATELDDAQDAWADRFRVERHGADSMTIISSRGVRTRLNRCPG